MISAQGRRRAAFFAALLFLFAGMWWLNAHTPLMMDDYDYSFSWATGEPLAGLVDVLASQAAHYRLWGGRSVVHAIAQLFLYVGKGAFNAANAAVYVLLIVELLALSRGRGEGMRAWAALAVHILLMALTPFFGTVFLWLDGACNYLWGTALGLLPLLIAKSDDEGGFFARGGAWRAALGAALCFIAGWTNENTACGVFAALLLAMIAERWRGGRIAGRRIVWLLAQGLGIAVMLLAPGNFARAAGEPGRGLLTEMAYRFAVVTYCMARYCGIPIACALALTRMLQKRGAALRLGRTALLLGAALLSGYALLASPVISDRSFTGCLALCLSAAVGQLRSVLRTYAWRPRLRAACVAAGFALCVGATAYAAGRVMAHEAAWHVQLDRIEAAKAAGAQRVSICSVPAQSRFAMDITVEKDPAQWPNSTLSRAFGIEIAGE